MDILNYSDYRDFLKHTVEAKKKANTKFSYQSFANKLGVTKSYLKLVVEKRRHISLEKAFPICRFFKFTDFESQYFYFMLLKSNVKDPSDQEFFNSILRSYAAFKRINYDITASDRPREFFYDWVKMAILGLSQMQDFQCDVDWIHDKLGGDPIVEKTAVGQALDYVLVHKIIVIENGQIVRHEKPLIANVAPWDVAGYQRFQTGLLRTSQALDMKGKTNLHRPSRHQMYTLALSHTNIRKVADLYDEFEKKLLEIATEPQTYDALMMISNNGFRISKTDDTKIPGTPAASI